MTNEHAFYYDLMIETKITKIFYQQEIIIQCIFF